MFTLGAALGTAGICCAQERRDDPQARRGPAACRSVSKRCAAAVLQGSVVQCPEDTCPAVHSANCPAGSARAQAARVQVAATVAEARAAQAQWAGSSMRQRKQLLRIFNKFMLEHAASICRCAAAPAGQQPLCILDLVFATNVLVL